MIYFCDDRQVSEGIKALFKRSSVALTLADAQNPDFPLIGMNAAFVRLSGYTPGEILGQNCRFLQPKAGPGPVRKRMREFLEQGVEDKARFVVPNVRKDGTKFLNLLYLSQIKSNEGAQYILGSQFDITRIDNSPVDKYEWALRQDLKNLDEILIEQGWLAQGSYDMLADSQAIIAAARLDDPKY